MKTEFGVKSLKEREEKGWNARGGIHGGTGGLGKGGGFGKR